LRTARKRELGCALGEKAWRNVLCGLVGGVDGLGGVLEHAVCRVRRAGRLVDVGNVILSTQVDGAEFGRKGRAVQRARVGARNLRACRWLAYHGRAVAECVHLILEAQAEGAMGEAVVATAGVG
jgi:hypothetical protein